MVCGVVGSGTAVSGAYMITNVNPTTGKINNTDLYTYWTDGSHAQRSAEFIVTDNSVTLSTSLSSAYLTYVSMMYTYN